MHNLELVALRNLVVIEDIHLVEVVVHTLAEVVVVHILAEEDVVRTLAEEVAARSPAVLPDRMAAVVDFAEGDRSYADHTLAAEVAHSPVGVAEAGRYNFGHTRELHIDLAEVRHTAVPPKDEKFARL